ncbi:MAG: Glu/Leu/Phe/Val dehydrogenase dimerization domain-containing protein [Planctomycetota bacterium]
MLNRDFELVEIAKDADAGCMAIIALHSTRSGPAFGGIRRWRYPSSEDALADALRLAEAMTLKCAIAGVPGGGGKAVILDRPDLPRDAAYRLVGRLVENLRGRYYTGPDVGTDAADLEHVAAETAYVARPGPEGPGDLAEPTAIGVQAGIEAVALRLGHQDLRGVRVAVQGLGQVGSRLARSLARSGARLVLTDLDQDRAAAFGRELDAEVVAPAAIVATECDVFAPCALGGVIDDETLPTLRAKAVAGSANNVLASERHGAELFARGVLHAPDFVISAGALIHGALYHLEGAAPPIERVRHIGQTVGEVLDRAIEERVPPEVLALQLARERAGAGR